MELHYLIFFSRMLLVYSFMVCLATASTNFTDQKALLAFKAQIDFDDPTNVLANNWTTKANFCKWIGVSCSLRRQRVAALNLSGMALQGTISPLISNLSFLVKLDLSNNNFYGHLPDELGHLRRLRLIFIYKNQLEGKIPPSLSQCRELETISTSNNLLEGELPSWLDNLPKLRFLSLGFNNLIGSIPISIGNISRLEELSLPNNYLDGEIPKQIGNLRNLVLLDLANNSLTGAIPFTILNMSSLQEVHFTSNSLSGNVPVDIGYRLPKLQGLFVYGNQLSGLIPSSFCQCGELQVLSLSYNKFTGSIPRDIGNLSKLEELYLGGNHLTGTIPPSMGNLSRLVIFFAETNYLSGEIPEELGHLLSLEELNLEINTLIGEIPQSIFNISLLKVISFGFNQLSGYLPVGIGLQLPNLERLVLAVNQLTGRIPNSISNASKLTLLELSKNLFSGNIPVSLGNLEFLTILNLQDNQLKNVPGNSEVHFLTSLVACRYLEVLVIGYNPLGGLLPNSIGNLSTSLQLFDASECQMKGSITRRIGNLSNLITLGLSDNGFNETIPSEISQLEELQRLYLDGNNIQGSIPHELCHLTQLGELFLKDNRISGSIPNCIGNLSRLQKITLASNKLTWEIPKGFWRLKTIVYLNLSQNFLHGYLPLELGTLKNVDEIDLSQNQFLGTIPSTIGGLQMLSYLNLSKNSFEGHIPQSFSKLISLQVMDLSSNALTGTIPKSLEKLSDLSYLNLSFNRLQGEIPLRGVFANLTAQSFLGNVELCGAPKLQVPPCVADALPKSRTKLLLLKCILPIVASIVVVVAFIILSIKYQRNKQHIPNKVDLPLHTVHRAISYQELLLATNNFSEDNLLGVGSFSSVYKATLSDGMPTAVKVLDLQMEGAIKSFDAECQVMRNVRHRNLVKVISVCSNFEFKALVLDFMPSGSLEKWLYSHNYYLDLLQRLNIMIDVALGLEYLHHGYSELVVHCDLKPSNILLDEDMVAHMGDFGIAKVLAENNSTTQTKTLGTIGYIAPEYGSEGRVSARGDVYSYGLVLMETFTRKKPTDEMFAGLSSLRQWVNASFPHLVREVIDANLLREEEDLTISQHCISNIFELALLCSREAPEERTNMKEVVVKLMKIKQDFLVNVGAT